MKFSTASLSLAALAVSPAFAADVPDSSSLSPVVVTATRTATPEQQIGSAITVITAEDIQARQINNVADALRIVPGLDVVRAGGLGQQTSVFLRGANANHTLVLIDGIEMNDPSNPNGSFDFSTLHTDNIERIEVLRGAASAAYGSDAIGGVINVITKKGQGPAKFTASAEGGAYDTWKTAGSVAGGDGVNHYSLDVSRLEVGGFSAADRVLGNKETDGYRNTTVSGRGGVALTENLDLGTTVRYTEGKSFLDNCGGRGCDDPNSWSEFNQLYTRGFAHLTLFGGLWEQTLGGAYSRTDRHNLNPFDAVNAYDIDSRNLGEKLKLDYQSILRPHESNTITLGFEEEADSLSSVSAFNGAVSALPVKTMNTASYYAQDQISLFERSFTTIGVRYDDNNRFGGHVTWRVNELYTIKETDTRLKGGFGTGFRAPALFQLYDTLFGSGNPDLKPETSDNWDIGLEQDLLERHVTVGASYFHNRYANLIQNPAPFPYRSVNIGRAESKGVETFVEARVLADLTLRGNYTYQETQDLATGDPLLRRPKHKASFDADYRFLEKAHAHLNVLVVGRKADVFSTEVPGYTLVNLSGSYDLHPNVQVYARVDNLFNKRYEELFGYGTTGIAGYGGVKLAF